MGKAKALAKAEALERALAEGELAQTDSRATHRPQSASTAGRQAIRQRAAQRVGVTRDSAPALAVGWWGMYVLTAQSSVGQQEEVEQWEQ